MFITMFVTIPTINCSYILVMELNRGLNSEAQFRDSMIELQSGSQFRVSQSVAHFLTQWMGFNSLLS